MSVSSRTILGDCRDVLGQLPEASIQCCVTSPPYWGLRDYGVDGQIGLERTPGEYVAKLVEVFRGVRRVLREDGTLWVNLGDSYARTGVSPARPDHSGSTLLGTSGHQSASRAAAAIAHRQSVPHGVKPKDLVGIPWMVAFALRDDGWYLRSDIIWSKPNPMPESVTDRPTKSHEYVFLLSKSEAYYYSATAISEPMLPNSAARYAYGFGGPKSVRLTAEEAAGPGTRTHPIGTRVPASTRNARTVWQIQTQPCPDAHFAVFPSELPRRCILAGSRPGDTVLDPFGGSGTTGRVAVAAGRNAILIELNPEYVDLSEARTAQTGLGL